MIKESLVYISRSCVPPQDAETEVNRIVAIAETRNPAFGITGALLFTGEYFAQVIEGDRVSIDGLIKAITDDPRHDQIMIVARGPIAERRFPDWSMAYFGPSQFVSRHVTRLLNDPPLAEQRRAAQWLSDLLAEFARSPRTAT